MTEIISRKPSGWLVTNFVALTLLITSGSANALTILLDFNDPGQSISQTTIFGSGNNAAVTTFEVTKFGFVEADRSTIINNVLAAVENDYYNISTAGPGNPMPAGKQLDIDFEIRNFWESPSNGDSEFYTMQIGDFLGGAGAGSLGFAGLGAARSATGDPSGIPSGHIIGTIFTDAIAGMNVGSALFHGDMDATVNAIAGTVSHEIAHTLSLGHIAVAGAITPNGLNPLLATGAIDLPNAARLLDREFSISGYDPQAGGAEVFYIQQLIDAVGLRDTPATVPAPPGLFILLVGLFAIRVLQRP